MSDLYLSLVEGYWSRGRGKPEGASNFCHLIRRYSVDFLSYLVNLVIFNLVVDTIFATNIL